MERNARVRTVLESVTRQAVKPQQSLLGSGLLDSFSLVDLVAALEKEFGIKIPNSDLNPRTFDTLERFDTYIAKRI